MILAIVRKEVLGSGRHGRTFAVRAAYIALLTIVTLPILHQHVRRMSQGMTFSASRAGQEFAVAFGIVQYLAVVLIAPALSIGAIARERAEGGLELLAAAGVRPWQVVLGKFSARLVTIALFLLSGAPLLFIGTLMGGIAAEGIALVLAHGFAAGALATAVGLLASGGFRQSVAAFVAAYVLLGAIFLGPPVLLALADITGHVAADLWALLVPLASVVMTVTGSMASSSAWIALSLPLALVPLALLPVVRFADPRRETAGATPARGKDSDPTPGTPRGRPASAGAPATRHGAQHPAVRVPEGELIPGNPVAWRDARTSRRGMASRLLRAAYLLVACGALCVPFLIAPAHGLYASNEMGRVTLFLIIGAGGLVALIVGSAAIAEERERRSMALLRLSLLRERELLAGKLAGLGRFLWPMLFLPALIAGVFFGQQDPLSIAVALAAAGVVLFAGMSVGIAFSAWARRPAVAVGTATGASIVYVVAPLFLLVAFNARLETEVVGLFNPAVMLAELMEEMGRVGDPNRNHEDLYFALSGLGILILASLASLRVAGAHLARREEG